MQKAILLVFFTQLWIGCVELAGFEICRNQHYYSEEKTDRLVLITYGDQMEIKSCLDYGELSFFQKLFIHLPDYCVTKVNKTGMKSVLKKCPRKDPNRSFLSLLAGKFPGISIIHKIFPGTLWCGAGNISSEQLDTGVFTRLDECCRTHDNCPDYIAVGETKYGLTNDGLGSYEKCECDEKFFRCLHDTGTIESDNVGFVFFNVLATPCFKKDYPIVKCLKKETALFREHCEEYEQDTSKEKRYQLFDSKIYHPNSITDEIARYFE